MNRIFRATSLRRAAITTGIFGAIAVLCAVSVTASATSVPLPDRQSAFCANLSATTDELQAKVTALKQKAGSTRNQQDATILSRQETWDAAIAEHRGRWDQQRQENFDKLEAKATTADQRAAVATYKTAITTAVTTRRTANDAARQTYRTAVQQLLASHRTAVNSQAEAFAKAVASAVQAAKSSCASQAGSAAAIRTTLKASLRTARQAFQSDRQKDHTNRDQLQALVNTRNAAIRANDQIFAAATLAARQTLRSAWHNSNL